MTSLKHEVITSLLQLKNEVSDRDIDIMLTKAKKLPENPQLLFKVLIKNQNGEG